MFYLNRKLLFYGWIGFRRVKEDACVLPFADSLKCLSWKVSCRCFEWRKDSCGRSRWRCHRHSLNLIGFLGRKMRGCRCGIVWRVWVRDLRVGGLQIVSSLKKKDTVNALPQKLSQADKTWLVQLGIAWQTLKKSFDRCYSFYGCTEYDEIILRWWMLFGA